MYRIMGIGCGVGEIGPGNAWVGENWPANHEVKEVCIAGTYEAVVRDGAMFGLIKTDLFNLYGEPFEKDRWKYDFKKLAGGMVTETDKRFDLFFAAYTLKHYTEEFLKKRSVYTPSLESILLKKGIDIEVGTVPVENAFFSKETYSIIYGTIIDRRTGLKCHLPADADIIVHEFGHLLVYSENRELGSQYSDIEGNAIHESLADLGAALYFGDNEMAESAAACMGIEGAPSADIGARYMYDPQLSLFYDEESHTRTELYSPVLWKTYLDIADQLISQGVNIDVAKSTAEEIMTAVTQNMSKFIPANPKKEDFARAFFNALHDVAYEGMFRIRHRMKNEGSVTKLIRTVKDKFAANAYWRRMIDMENVDDVFQLYPYVVDSGVRRNEDIEILIEQLTKKMEGSGTIYKKAYTIGRQWYYQQFSNGFPVEGSGIRFIKTARGVQMIDMRTAVPPPVPAEERPMSAADAWKKFRSLKTKTDIRAWLGPQTKRKNIGPYEAERIIKTVEGLTGHGTPEYDVVYLAGKDNPQYKFKTRDITVYVDSKDGSINLGRQSFF